MFGMASTPVKRGSQDSLPLSTPPKAVFTTLLSLDHQLKKWSLSSFHKAIEQEWLLELPTQVPNLDPS